MKTTRFIILCATLAAGLMPSAGCGNKEQYGKYNQEQMKQINLANKYDLPAPSGDTMVVAVHSETISSDEILAAFRSTLKAGAASGNTQMATIEAALKSAVTLNDETAFSNWAKPFIRELIRGKITDILLYQEARKTAPDTIDDTLEKAVESETARFIAGYGNNYALAESKIKEMGMDWQSFKEYQKKLIMTQSYLSSKLKNEKRFSQRQLRDYYEQHKKELFPQKSKVGFSVIEIQPEQLTAEQIADNKTAQAAAKAIAAQLVKDLEGGADFAERAKQYHGAMAGTGGTFAPAGPGAKVEPYNSLEAVALQMQPGAIKGPVEIADRVFVLRLDVLQLAEDVSFEKVQPQIEQRLLFEYRREQYQELINKLVKNTDMAQIEGFVEFCVNQAWRRWSQP